MADKKEKKGEKPMSSFVKMMKSPLSLRLIAYIILFSLSMTMLSAVMQTAFEYWQGRKTIQANLQFIEDSYLQPIATSNYHVNEKLLQVQLQGLVQLEDVVYVEVVDPERDEAYRITAGDESVRRDTERTFSLFYRNATGKTYEVGFLTVALNLDGLYYRLKNRIAGILAENVLRIFFITLFMLFLAQTVLTRHLTKITSYLDNVNLVHFEHELTLDRKPGKLLRPDELDRLVGDINNMRHRLREDIVALEKSRDDLHSSLEETVTSLASTTEKRDPYTAGHQQRVNLLACAIGKELGLSDEQIEGLHIAALLHDIGKITLPSEYLAKPTKLSKVEKSLIECHPEVGYDILKNINFPWPVADIVYQHHEHLDGSGYPRGLTDDDILLEAKILAVADVVEAMSSHRPYRPSLGISTALDEIRSGRGTRYHAPSVDACIRLIMEKKVEFASRD